MKTGIVDVGGGLRDIYGAGVLDRCLDEGIHFDLCIGVSAGSANLAAYLAGQRGRNYKFYTEYAFRKEYMSMKNFVQSRSYVGLDYAYSVLSNSDGEDPLDYAHIAADPAEFLVVASDAESGTVKYFTKADMSQDNYDICKASCAIPFVCRPYPIGQRVYYDGALSDPVPVAKAMEEGCDKVVVILTRPKDVVRAVGKDEMIARRIRRKYPLASDNLLRRSERYNAGVALAKEYQRQGKALIVAPPSTGGLSTLSRDKDALTHFYRRGYADAASIGAFLNG